MKYVSTLAFIRTCYIFTLIMKGFKIGYCLSLSAENEPHRDKTNKMACAPNEASDQPGHLPSLIRVFDVRFMGS